MSYDNLFHLLTLTSKQFLIPTALFLQTNHLLSATTQFSFDPSGVKLREKLECVCGQTWLREDRVKAS